MNTATPHASLPATRLHGGRSQLFWLGAAGIGVVWAAVIVISVFSPDNVSGSQQDHFPIAAVLTWVWGLIASRTMLTTLVAQRGYTDRLPDIQLLVGGIAAVWVAAAGVAVFGPEIVTGTDPTRFPVSAVLAPIAAMLITGTACQTFTSLTGPKAPAGGLRE